MVWEKEKKPENVLEKIIGNKTGFAFFFLFHSPFYCRNSVFDSLNNCSAMAGKGCERKMWYILEFKTNSMQPFKVQHSHIYLLSSEA